MQGAFLLDKIGLFLVLVRSASVTRVMVRLTFGVKGNIELLRHISLMTPSMINVILKYH